VYYVVVDRDGAGRIFHPIAYLDRLAAVVNAPIYSWVESAMDHGIVGGSLKSHVLQAQAIAGQALRVLHGERADLVPVSSPNLNVLQVDSRQMRRWGLEESRLPPGTIVKFREPSAWDRYGLYILSAAVVFITQTLLIAGLFLQSERRRRVESELRWREADLQNSYERIRDLGARLLHSQDTERSRIARELHDDISQQVALLEMDLEQLSGSIEAEPRLLAAEARDRATSIARSVHDLSHRLHPAKLRLIGLVAALDGLRHELSRSDVAITFAYDGVPSALPQELTLCLFRVAQEALQNALKYSGARQISLDLRWSARELTMTVVDDGAGFDVEGAWGRGLGLVSMSERLEGVGGSVAVRSRRGEGTRVEASVPAHVVERTVADSIFAKFS
jgi:signal transduction histidine kinase